MCIRDSYNADANIDYLQECEYPAEPGPDWEVVSTDPSNSHIIGLMPGASFEVDGVSLTPGSFIGVFYTDDNGEWACGGFTEWDGDVGVIVAQMDDSTTDEKDGFAEGENIHFRVWSQDFICEYSDASNPVYSPVDWFFTSDDGAFQSNGISGLDGFEMSNLALSETPTVGDVKEIFNQFSNSRKYAYNSRDYFLQASDLELDKSISTTEAVSEMRKLMDQIDEIFIPDVFLRKNLEGKMKKNQPDPFIFAKIYGFFLDFEYLINCVDI